MLSNDGFSQNAWGTNSNGILYGFESLTNDQNRLVLIDTTRRELTVPPQVFNIFFDVLKSEPRTVQINGYKTLTENKPCKELSDQLLNITLRLG